MSAMISFFILLLSYVLGSLSGSLLLGRWRGVDIRQRGSGNAGGTNAFRTLGWRFALGVVVIDVGKGVAAVGLALAADVESWVQAAAVLAAVAGHVWPLFYGFRGGKGAATLIGGLLLFWPAAVPVLLSVWVLALISSGYVGLSTILAAAALVPYAVLEAGAEPVLRIGLATLAAGFIVFTHRSNLQRLWQGNEHRFDRIRLLRWRRSGS